MGLFDDLVDPARPALARAERVLSARGLTTTPLPDVPFGVGFGVAFSGGTYSVVSVGAGGNESIVQLSVGVLKDLQKHRLEILDECNSLTRDNTAYPYFLHDADAGWDVLLQVRLPVQLVESGSSYFAALVEQLPQYVVPARNKLQQLAAGSPYEWTADDTSRLLIRSLV